MISGMMAEHAEWARLNYKLREATLIDGVEIPAGAMVSRNNDGPLRSVSLPDGMTLAASATWQHDFDGRRQAAAARRNGVTRRSVAAITLAAGAAQT
jgi:hypothetical protein